MKRTFEIHINPEQLKTIKDASDSVINKLAKRISIESWRRYMSKAKWLYWMSA